MSAQFAEATVKAGIKSYDKWLATDLEALQNIFTTAAESGIIPAAPELDTLFDINKEIAQLYYGCIAQGKVLNETGEPIEGATVHIGYYKTETNANGIWRLSGLRVNDTVRIFIEANGFDTYVNNEYPTERDEMVVGLPEVILSPGHATTIRLDEYDGDSLPPLTAYKIDVQLEDVNSLRQGDLLSVDHLYSNGDIKLGSMHLAMENNRLIIRSYRVPASIFNGEVELHSYWRYSNGRCLQTNITDSNVLLRSKMYQQAPKIDTTNMSRDEVLNAFVPATFTTENESL